jgi:diguanylate cyclase (GGDEF)-like protein
MAAIPAAIGLPSCTLVAAIGAPVYLAVAAVGVGALAVAVAIVTRMRRAYERDSGIDRITGLPARASWEAAVAREVARGSRYGQPFCVALVDLDRPRPELGDDRDQPIHDVAQAWRVELRQSDLLARVGDARFGALLVGCLPTEARIAIDRVRSATPARHASAGGIASWDGAEPAQALIARAEQALARAKRAGGATIVLRATEPPGSRASRVPRSP